ncbi:3-hydroxyacyl-CoA dehydrogenase [Streptomyces sp. S3(2020)]|uniref:3-hydroxyacyl-CoA dehydrogenase NAD-binding domain-containing protein n=1 Tax=Streptomyces sp. S3(2020) TaxID=2732044 RepID=UPI001489C6F5|nr:3-hydroxyacyl-CoA dehydrogenase NAD-binding domain-containing protein [Streptomyces sp. S3(2020)]NNN29376.1 3-hydroxyacyl-CoA dehydrogenase [Streptomyces sp. S3(2020)]
MSPSDPRDDTDATSAGRVAVLGCGLIGRSWAALFLAAGKSVAVHDPDPSTEVRVRRTLEEAWPVLTALGLAKTDAPEAELIVCDDPRDAVAGAEFVQESVPERIGLKHELYGAIEPVLGADTVVASSASGLTLGELQDGWRQPTHLVLGHPFNPPHLIPLVEVMGNERTGPGVVARARRFYESVGKVTIEVRREVPGHVANRLQAALWREAIHLVNEGVATVRDIDTAVSSGPGLRWAVMGPTELFHLGGDDGGLAAFCARYGDSFNRWWDDLGRPHLDEATAARLVNGLSAAADPDRISGLAAKRDALLTAVVAATHGHLAAPATAAASSPTGAEADA